MTPLSYADLEWGWNFSSEQCVEGMVGIHANFLRSVLFSCSLGLTDARLHDDKRESYATSDEALVQHKLCQLFLLTQPILSRFLIATWIME